MQLSRRAFLKRAAGVAALTAISSIADLSAAQEKTNGKYIPGIYGAKSDGFAGSISIHVEVSEEEILSVRMVENTEPYIQLPSQTAARLLCAEIVEKQSLGVDIVAGATFTSRAILAAAAALSQAGGDVDALQQPFPYQSVIGKEESVDILVIGGGATGLSAALAAATVDLKRVASGYSVLLIEHNAYIGGSTAFSGGGYAVCSGTIANEELSASMSGDALADIMENLSEATLNRSLINNMAAISGATANGLIALASPFPTAKATAMFPCKDDRGYIVMRSHQYGAAGGSAYGVLITEHLKENCEEMGVEIRTRCSAESLLVKDGAVVGVRVKGVHETHNILAKKVVLATGGYAQNAEMIAEYAPDYVGSIPYCGSYSKGKGIQMALEAVNAEIVGEGMIAYPGMNAKYGIHGNQSSIMMSGPGVWVNRAGNRFVDGRGIALCAIGMHICQQPGSVAITIFDSTSPRAALMPRAIEEGYGYMAHSLEDLAEQLKIPYDAMMASIESARAAIEAGVDEEFGVPVANLNAVREAPFYAAEVRSIVIGSIAGLHTGSNCEILNGAGEAVPNLFGAGEAIMGNIFSKYYVCGSYSIGSCIPTGRMAGEQAKATM